MCGIAGIYRLGAAPLSDAERAADRAQVERMMQTIEYRGPDDRGLENPGRATFGVQRLAILDPAHGHQPIADAEGRVWAMQNGELYNFPELRRDLETRHRFRTRTDTEVLPLLYRERGVELVTALRGMFALAVCDTADDTLLLARDPLGVKPLYYARLGERLLFASEMKALLTDPALPRDLDLDALGRYLALGYVPGEGTVLRAVRKLRPGCRLIARREEVRIERYWRWPKFLSGGAPAPASLEEAADRAGTLLGNSAVSMLLSDAPVGVLLSGGLDSSVLVGLIPEDVRRELRTFTIGFEKGGAHDERAYARRVAAHLGTRHVELSVPLDVAAELPALAGYLDEPCADPAAVPAHLVARAASAEVKVLLSGTGGDEVFGGYRRYRLGKLLRRFSWLPRGLAATAARALAERRHHRRTASGERAIWLRKLCDARSRANFFEAYLSVFEPAPPARWVEALAVAADPAAVGRALWSEMVAELGAPPEKDEAIAFSADHLYYLPDDLLLKEDRTTMGASVEGRVPYLDPPLVEFASQLPLAMRWNGRESKRVLRVLARRVLPPDIAARPKHGFSVPIEDWLRGPLDALLGDVLAGTGSGVFDRKRLRLWHDQHRQGLDRSGPLWAALLFELWWTRVGSAPADRLAEAGRPLRAVHA